MRFRPGIFSAKLRTASRLPRGPTGRRGSSRRRNRARLLPRPGDSAKLPCSSAPPELNINLSRKIAVYSTYCGSSESKTFHEIPASPKYPYFFISNNPAIRARAAELGWTPISLDVPVSADPVVSATQAKIAKVLPHTFPQLAEYDFLFYADDKIYVDPDRIESLIDAFIAADSPLALRRHPFLPPNVLYEFGEAMLQPRYKSEWEKTVKYICDQVNAGAKLECETLYTTNAFCATCAIRMSSHSTRNGTNTCFAAGLNARSPFTSSRRNTRT